VGPGTVLDGRGKSRPTGIRSPDRPAHSVSLYRLVSRPTCYTVYVITPRVSVGVLYKTSSTGVSHWPSTQKHLGPKPAGARVIFSSCFALPSIKLTFNNGQNNLFCSVISGYPLWVEFYVNVHMLSGGHHHNHHLSSFYQQQNANHTT
jgi:hypothetical protein